MSRWCVDIDSVTMDTVGRQIALANQRFGTSYTIDHIVTWLWEECGFPAEVCDYVWGDEVFQRLTFHWTCPAIDGAVETLHRMKATGNQLYFVSDRPDRLYRITRAWLDHRGLKEAVLVFTNRETYPKSQAARDLYLDVVIEDAPHGAVDLAALDQIRRVWLMDYPYNRSVPQHPKITRVQGWSDIAAAVLGAELAAS